jgi:simple sugar transport system ATP-binding protein
MAADGRSIVFISHKLGEVLAIADRITVMRHGRVTAAGIPASGTTRTDLARLMVGRAVFDVLDRAPIQPGPVVLDVSGVSAENDRGLPALRDVSLQVRAGEILGIAAVAGNGQSELAEVITRPSALPGPHPDRRPGGGQPFDRDRDQGGASRTCRRTARASARPPTSRSSTT